MTTIDEYIASFDDARIREILRKVRAEIREVLPSAREKISYGMPTFWQGENLVHFAAAKNHLGIYPGNLTNLPTELREKIAAKYKTSTGAIQFPYEKIDYNLIREIARTRAEIVKEKANFAKNSDKF
jgi:uncharacterized protein YdhG (YjbR/CyaY superfamily)